MVQGGGAGSMIGPGPLADTVTGAEAALVLAGAKDAEARPAIATNRAKKRMADFIFGNLSNVEIKGNFFPLVDDHTSYKRISL